MLFVDDNNRSMLTIPTYTRSGNSKSTLKSNYSTIMITSSKSKKGSSSRKLDQSASPKSILPHLHTKTHYKGATTFSLAYPGSFYCPTTKNVDKAVSMVKSDREKVSQRNLFNAFRNIEGMYFC